MTDPAIAMALKKWIQDDLLNQINYSTKSPQMLHFAEIVKKRIIDFEPVVKKYKILKKEKKEQLTEAMNDATEPMESNDLRNNLALMLGTAANLSK